MRNQRKKVLNVIKLLESISVDETKLKKRLRSTASFFLKLIALGAVFRIFILFSPETYILESWLASLSSYILGFLNLQLQVQGSLLLAENSSYLVTQDCLGWKSVFGFTALMIASTENIIKDLKFILIGIIGILIINITRVVTTIYLSHHNIIPFNIIHTILWKWGLAITILVIWGAWFTGFINRVRETI